MKKIISIVMFCLLYFESQYSQEKKELDSVKVRKNAIGISAGIPGFGFDYARKLSTKLSGKFRYSTFKMDDFDAGEIDVNGNMVNGSVSIESNIIDFLVEFLPFKNSSFKLVGGVGVINKLNINVFMVYDNSVTFGDVVLDKEDYGDVNLGFSWDSSVAPYLGLGFGRAVPNSRLGFGIEAGSYFTSSPLMTLEATKLLAPTADQIEEVNETFKTWKFIPLIQFRLVYTF
ncbi:MAG: hypothetical protein COY55_07850 [Flavobacteriaceae bacterium CG_4_10_14_0_8_um_filter_31_99]|nr:MAG: hypothetical protein COW43_02200 [Flavobacteriaceae bacterium CG17_big_fil_post_rev_8_21_14_2_50_31_13]PIX11896.1 MAG: hypothetical protein COZ74_12830 [Flavobacteriaceae bacterium CG_4_8_14_3_um_filter_31_8]PIZ10621.1 MAG: hypothetical protein COY55_07850 [Flavobacteriaceae bacterium CG_4_10_14_0_8_um_filter_31_99]